MDNNDNTRTDNNTVTARKEADGDLKSSVPAGQPNRQQLSC